MGTRLSTWVTGTLMKLPSRLSRRKDPTSSGGSPSPLTRTSLKERISEGISTRRRERSTR